MRGISTEEEGRKRNGSTLKGRLEEDVPHCNTEEKHNTKPCDQIYSETEQPPEKEERGGGFKKL
jgi:hypothetical protein